MASISFEELVEEHSSRQALWNHLFEYKEGRLYWKNPRAVGVKKGALAGSMNTRYYAVMVAKKTCYLHKVIFEMFNGDCDTEVDHRDTNTLNNDKDNLRAATRLDNTRNVGVRKDNTLGIKGVHFDKISNKFIAQTTVDSKRKCVGRYDTPEEAKAAYDTAITELHGEFARS